MPINKRHNKRHNKRKKKFGSSNNSTTTTVGSLVSCFWSIIGILAVVMWYKCSDRSITSFLFACCCGPIYFMLKMLDGNDRKCLFN